MLKLQKRALRLLAWLNQGVSRFSLSEDQRVDEDDELTSSVLLLREPKQVDAVALRFAAERTWGRSFATETNDSRHFVKAAPPLTTFMKVGPHLLTIFAAAEPYLSLGEDELQEFLPEPERQEAWRTHRAWLALNYHNKETDEESKYCILGNLASELLDGNCTGVWFPKMSAFLPNMVGAYADLKSIAASKPVDLD